MTARASAAYGQARMQARLARLPDPSFWSGLAGELDLAGFKARVSNTALASWMDLPSSCGVPVVERHLRRELVRAIYEALSWVPPAWKPAVSGLVLLPALPFLSAGRLGGARESDEPGHLATQGISPVPAMLLQRLVAQMKDHQEMSPLQAWWRIWQPTWRHLQGQAQVNTWADSIRQHLTGFNRLPPGAAWPARDDLYRRMHELLHAQVLQPTAVFPYLTLLALSIEHLRAAWLNRLLWHEGDARDASVKAATHPTV